MKSIKFLLAIITIYVHGQNNAIEVLESSIPKWQEEYKVPAVALAIIEDGQVLYTNTFGEQRKGVPASRKTIFTVASLTKPIFSMVALNLIGNGELLLDEPLYRYHMDPDLEEDENLKSLNARNILSHQSGFVNWRNMSPSKKLEFKFKPGSQYLYSGEGFEYLRKALTNKTGKTLPELAEELLFGPLRLKNISFTWNPSWDLEKVAYPYNRNLKEYDYAPRTELNAAAGLQTTIMDYAVVCSYVLKGGGLSQSLFDEMITPQVRVKENLFYGLGWEIIPSLSNGALTMMHSGDENGIKTFVVLFPKSKSGMVVFTNADEGFKVYRKVVESYFKEGKEIFDIKNKKMVPIETYEIPVERLKRYTGRFEIKENVAFDVVEDNGKLNLVIPGQKPVRLVAQTESIFLVDEEVKVEFVKKEKEQFQKVLIYQYGVKSYEGKRME